MDDERLLNLAVGRGILSAAQLDAARTEQRALADRGIARNLWFVVQDLGYLTDADARLLRRVTSSSQVRALEVEGYVILGRIGQGGMGEVFRARKSSGEEAAVKLLPAHLAESEENRLRFAREAAATLPLRHPHIVASYGNGHIDGLAYLLMEVVEGPSLKGRLSEKGRLTPTEGRCVLRQISEALAYAWSKGVLHRDVKPANIILGPPRPGREEPFCCKLCDFGLAKVWVDGVEPGQLTGSGLALGTPHYMSPEQASGEHDLDHRADMYGLGAAIYHALLGQTLYSGRSSAVIMAKHVTESADLSALERIGVDAGLIGILAHMLAKRRDERFPDWSSVTAALASGARPAVATTAAAPAQPVVAARTQRGRLAVAIVLGLGVAAALAGGAWWVLGRAAQ